ncbi:MAG: MATE family efflux transporter [Lachnospiraceae bacterium]
MSTEAPVFSKAAIRRLIFPLIVEQFLAVTVGMADTIMVTGSGELAVSGISLVDTLNILLINVFTALATGGAVVASHYLGEGKRERACTACNQLILVVFSLSFSLAVLSVVFNYPILHGIYGDLDPQVMGYARTYYYLTACSFPFLGVYNGAAAICRSMGNSKISMKVSVLMNGMNVVGNAILIYGFHMSVEGAGISTLVSRITAAVIMMIIVRDQKLELHIDPRLRLGFSPDIIKNILRVGIPVSVENGLFQGGKLMVAGLVSSFGTVSIAANAVANTIASFQCIAGTAIGLAMITVVGQAVGAGRYQEAKRYAVRLCLLVICAHMAVCIPMLFFLKPIIGFYNVSPETMQLAWQVSMLHGICCMFIWPWSFTLPNALRAADDVRFAMCITMLSMFLCRVAMSWVLGKYFGLGLLGVWIAMILDWVVRGVIYSWRLAAGGWLKNHKARLAAQG